MSNFSLKWACEVYTSSPNWWKIYFALIYLDRSFATKPHTALYPNR